MLALLPKLSVPNALSPKAMRLSFMGLLVAGVTVVAPGVQASETRVDGNSNTPAFTPAEQEEIGQIAASYLAQHPEYLVAAQETLRQNQIIAMQQKIGLAAPAAADALLHDKNTPSIGPANSSVAVITFTDYQSEDSRALDSVMAKFIQHNSHVRVINKEFPLSLSRWPVSGEAALAAQQAWNEKGAEGYYALRKALFATGHVDGNMTNEDVHAAMKTAKISYFKEHEQVKKERDELNANLELGQDLGMTIAPTVIVMSQKGASASTTTVFTRAPTEEQLAQAVALASQAK